ncbi:MAG: alanine racemase [Acutalibacteraceae bacterium]|nr:alanine racemase [Acutalibacteraceae bacterium]
MNFLHRTWVEIDLNALSLNFNTIKKHCSKTKIMAVVKANAYGHSVKDIAPKLQELGADSFAVSNLVEALQLREYGITRPILILGYTPTENADILAQNDITQAVFSYEFAEKLSKNAQAKNVTVKIHIKLDTGMSRLGFDCQNDNAELSKELLDTLRLPNLEFEGIFTHFCVADSCATDCVQFTNNQYERFIHCVEQIEKAGFKPKYKHCCNSAGSSLSVDKHLDFVRPGIILYGLTPDDSLTLPFNLAPVMTFKSVISMVKTIKAGDTVSYGRTFTAEKDMKVATVTAGYADGYPRALSNKASVLVNGKRAKVIGRVCMDQFTIDVSDIENVNEGDEVILFGKELPVEELARLADTINYEIVCGISPRVPRIISKHE